MFRLNKNLLIVVAGVVALVIILLVILISNSTKKTNPEANKLSQKQLLESLAKKGYKIKEKLQNDTEDEYNIFIRDEPVVDLISEVYNFIEWDKVKSIQKFEVQNQIVIVIPEIKFLLEDWKMLKTKFVQRTRNNGQEVSIQDGLIQWAENHDVWNKLKINIESEGEGDITQPEVTILSYHSGCFLGYAMYCLDDRIKRLDMYGCPAFFSEEKEVYDVNIFVSLNDVWSKLPLTLDSETPNYYLKGLLVAQNENSYKIFSQFYRLV